MAREPLGCSWWPGGREPPAQSPQWPSRRAEEQWGRGGGGASKVTRGRGGGVVGASQHRLPHRVALRVIRRRGEDCCRLLWVLLRSKVGCRCFSKRKPAAAAPCGDKRPLPPGWGVVGPPSSSSSAPAFCRPHRAPGDEEAQAENLIASNGNPLFSSALFDLINQDFKTNTYEEYTEFENLLKERKKE